MSGPNTIASTPLMNVPPIRDDEANSRGEAKKPPPGAQWTLATPLPGRSCPLRTLRSGGAVDLRHPSARRVDDHDDDARVAPDGLLDVEGRHPISAGRDAAAEEADLVPGWLEVDARPGNGQRLVLADLAGSVLDEVHEREERD